MWSAGSLKRRLVGLITAGFKGGTGGCLPQAVNASPHLGFGGPREGNQGEEGNCWTG